MEKATEHERQIGVFSDSTFVWIVFGHSTDNEIYRIQRFIHI